MTGMLYSACGDTNTVWSVDSGGLYGTVEVGNGAGGAATVVGQVPMCGLAISKLLLPVPKAIVAFDCFVW